MDKAIKVGDLACFYVCGERYEHTVTAVIGPKSVEVAQGYPLDKVYGPREIATLRKNGRWIRKGDGHNAGYYYIETRR